MIKSKLDKTIYIKNQEDFTLIARGFYQLLLYNMVLNKDLYIYDLASKLEEVVVDDKEYYIIKLREGNFSGVDIKFIKVNKIEDMYGSMVIDSIRLFYLIAYIEKLLRHTFKPPFTGFIGSVNYNTQFISSNRRYLQKNRSLDLLGMKEFINKAVVEEIIMEYSIKKLFYGYTNQIDTVRENKYKKFINIRGRFKNGLAKVQ